MFLCIDLSEKDTIQLTVFSADTTEHVSYPKRNRELLACIEALLKEKKLDKKDIQGIMVVVGSGSFTNTRVAVTVANTWGYAAKIPLLAIEHELKGDLQAHIPLLLQQPVGQYISATYSGEPNIGPKKKSS